MTKPLTLAAATRVVYKNACKWEEVYTIQL